MEEERCKNLVIMPLLPNRMIKPIPCEMDGINIGKVIRTVNKYLHLIWVLFIAHAKQYARTIDITVASNVEVIEFIKHV